jgi:hypothetical protein
MKITASQLRKIIKEEVKRLTEGPEEEAAILRLREEQKVFYDALRQAEDALMKVVEIVEKSGKGSPEKFGGQGSQQVNLKAVLAQISNQRNLEHDVPEYGGGLFGLPEPK